MKLTIGMATFDDFYGVSSTVQSLLMHHDVSDAEILVIDNNPESEHGKETRDFCSKAGDARTPVRYIAMPGSTGTTQPRQRVFDEARGEYVLCIDAHVFFAQYAIADLWDYFSTCPEEDRHHIYSGPILSDNRTIMATQFDPVWRSQMWGIWGLDPRGDNPRGAPFETWGHGLGVFACKRSSWLGFNPHFRGFGGEEGYIHQKFRRAGRKSICLPFLRWWHRFQRPGGIHYPRSIYQKTRNYVLGAQELGESLAPIYEHFVGGKLLSEADWQYILADPIRHEHAPGSHIKGPPKKPGPTPNLDELLIAVAGSPRDLDQHAKFLRQYASSHKRIMAVVKRAEWNVILAAARPDRLRVWQKEAGPMLELVHRAVAQESPSVPRTYATSITKTLDPEQITDMEECDLLVLDTVNEKHHLLKELNAYGGKVSRDILVRGTGAFGGEAEGGGEGQFSAIREWLSTNPEWFVALHETKQWGYTILSRDQTQRPPKEIELVSTAAPVNRGPGTELKKILSSMGINPSAACDCRGKQAKMDTWGVDGCRKNFDVIVGWMRENHERWGWRDRLSAATKAVTSGLAFKLNPLDPFPSLIEVAIERAEKREADDAAGVSVSDVGSPGATTG